MDSRLSIILSINSKCELIAIDQTNYTSLADDISNHITLDILVYNDSIVNYKIYPIIENNCSHFLLNNDGLFTYKKLIIPCLDHFKTDEGNYEVSGKYFFYDFNFYYANKDLNSIEELSEINKITDLSILWDNKDTQGFFWYDNNIFSICNLEKCLIFLQKQMIENLYINKCILNSDLKNKRDFILDSVFVLKYLISKNNYLEAQRILNNLSLCTNICNKDSYLLNSDCNCGTTL